MHALFDFYSIWMTEMYGEKIEFGMHLGNISDKF